MESLKNTLWNLVIVVLALVLAYLLYIRGKLDSYLPPDYVSTKVLPTIKFKLPGVQAPVPGAADAPATAPIPASAPVAAASPSRPVPPVRKEPSQPERVRPTAAAPAPPAAASTPATPAPVTLATLQPRQIPREVKLTKAHVFPVILNGRPSGSLSAPAGTTVKVAGVRGEKVTVQLGASTLELPVEDTDLLERARTVVGPEAALHPR